jgi:hypothetical protein
MRIVMRQLLAYLPVLCVAALLVQPAAAKAKFIHVKAALSTAAVPNPPADEMAAAKARGAGTRVLRARVATIVPDAIVAATVYPVQRSYRPVHHSFIPGLYYASRADLFAGGVGVITPDTYYGASDQTFASVIYYQRPLWDSDHFLPAAAWSEQPQLWSSKVR